MKRNKKLIGTKPLGIPSLIQQASLAEVSNLKFTPYNCQNNTCQLFILEQKNINIDIFLIIKISP